MKTAISIPDSVFQEAEAAANRLSMTRSQLYVTALKEYLRNHRSENVTDKLNHVYIENPSCLDPVFFEIQRLTVEQDAW